MSHQNLREEQDRGEYRGLRKQSEKLESRSNISDSLEESRTECQKVGEFEVLEGRKME